MTLGRGVIWMVSSLCGASRAGISFQSLWRRWRDRVGRGSRVHECLERLTIARLPSSGQPTNPNAEQADTLAQPPSQRIDGATREIIGPPSPVGRSSPSASYFYIVAGERHD